MPMDGATQIYANQNRNLKRDRTTQEFLSGTFTSLPRAYWPNT